MALLDATALGQSKPGSNGNERVLHIIQHSRTEATPSGGFMSYPGLSLGAGLIPLQLFYCPSRLSWPNFEGNCKQLSSYSSFVDVSLFLRKSLICSYWK